MTTTFTAKFFSEGGPQEIDVELEDGNTYYDLLNALNINVETVVVLRNGVPVPGDDVAISGEIEIVKVVSSG